MNTDSVIALLSTIHPVSNDFRIALEKEMIPITFPKNYALLDPPRVSDHAYFLNSGFAMSYYFDEGKKVTDSFWKAGQVMVCFESFFERVPSRNVIQLMTQSEVLCISHDSVQTLFMQYPEAGILYRGIINRYQMQTLERIRDMQRLSAMKRFEKFLRTYPEVELIVPQDAIASYLGITPQSLSRIKRYRGGS